MIVHKQIKNGRNGLDTKCQLLLPLPLSHQWNKQTNSWLKKSLKKKTPHIIISVELCEDWLWLYSKTYRLIYSSLSFNWADALIFVVLMSDCWLAHAIPNIEIVRFCARFKSTWSSQPMFFVICGATQSTTNCIVISVDFRVHQLQIY